MERNCRQVDFKGAAFPIAAAAKTSQQSFTQSRAHSSRTHSLQSYSLVN